MEVHDQRRVAILERNGRVDAVGSEMRVDEVRLQRLEHLPRGAGFDRVERLLQRAARLPEAMRADFLGHIPDNARLLTRARAAGLAE